MKQITRLIRVTDTRQFEEIGDRWVPIPGSGSESECARCGRIHEIHAEVELEDGAHAIVGVSCAKQRSLDVEIRRAAGRATTTAKLRCELARVRAELERVEAIHAAVDALPVPTVTFGDSTPRAVGRRAGQISRAAFCGDAEAPSWGDHMTDEMLAKLARSHWRDARLGELGLERGTRPLYWLRDHVEVLERRLAKRESD